jgi:superfamily I DNA/RNA helicase
VDNAEPAALREALFREVTQPVIPDSQGDIVRIMSLHKSKGLTAKLVLVCGCVAGALPTVKGFDPVESARQIQEQRRLFYVAITRATDILVISSSVGMSEAQAQQSGITFQRAFVKGRGRIARTSPSPFLGELGNRAPAHISTDTWRRDPRFNR